MTSNAEAAMRGELCDLREKYAYMGSITHHLQSEEGKYRLSSDVAQEKLDVVVPFFQRRFVGGYGDTREARVYHLDSIAW